MPIIRLKRNGADGTCWILRDGSINCPKEVIARLGWLNKASISPSYIKAPLLLLFSITEGDERGVQLRYSSPASVAGSGAAIKSKLLAKAIRLQTTLPLNGLNPIFPTNGLADLALLLETPPWVTFDFDKNGLQNLPKKTAVYELWDNKEVIRVGQGNLSQRIREHMGTTPLANEVRSARYFLANDEEESLAFEHILLCSFEQKAGHLPRFNAIRA